VRVWGALLLGGVTLAACAGSSDRAVPAPADTTAADSLVADTISRPPPPRTALVQGSVDSCSGTAPEQQCVVQVGAVVAYGMNTPPVASGTRTVRLRATVLDDRTIDALIAGGPWRMTLVHAGPQMRTPQGASTGPEWTLTEVRPAP